MKSCLLLLDKAIAYDNEDVCELLVKAGVPLNEPTKKFKRSPIHTAIDRGLLSATKCLLINGATLMTRDCKGFYPIRTAALNKQLQIVRFLLDYQYDPTDGDMLSSCVTYPGLCFMADINNEPCQSLQPPCYHIIA